MPKPDQPPDTRPFRSPHDALEEWQLRVEMLNDPGTRVCRRCVPDPHLWAEAVAGAHDAPESKCAFCGTAAVSVSYEDLAVVVERVIGELFVTVAESGAYHDDGEWSERVEDVADLAQELLDGAVDDDVLAPLGSFVADRNAVDHGFVRQRDVWASLYDLDEGEWRHFMARARSGDIAAGSESLFTDLRDDTLALFRRIEQTAELNGLFKQATPVLWRCRPAKPGVAYTTGADLGTAPAGRGFEGRLNAAGHSVFYGSTTLRGAVLEARQHGADGGLWAGRFAPSRPLYHLDVMEPPELPSVFAPGAADSHDAWAFLVRFARTLREPWHGDDKHYRPTQIFTAFLLARHEALRPDAVRYASSLDPMSENWAVFADHDHCVDADGLPASNAHADDEVLLLLDPSTAQLVAVADQPYAACRGPTARPGSSLRRARRPVSAVARATRPVAA